MQNLIHYLDRWFRRWDPVETCRRCENNHCILQQNTGNTLKMEAVFWPELSDVFSGKFHPNFYVFLQEATKQMLSEFFANFILEYCFHFPYIFDVSQLFFAVLHSSWISNYIIFKVDYRIKIWVLLKIVISSLSLLLLLLLPAMMLI